MGTPERAGSATLDELYEAPWKAELIDGEIVPMPPTGDAPSHAAFRIAASLDEHGRGTRSGRGVPDNAGFVVELPHRRTFSPDAAFWTGPPAGMKFFDGAPVFAVEVRSEGDYGPAAERALADKRADYFAAGTRVVWDVDLPDAERVVRVYRADAPRNPLTFARGDTAHAEPAVPGWTIAVDELFLEEVG